MDKKITAFICKTANLVLIFALLFCFCAFTLVVFLVVGCVNAVGTVGEYFINWASFCSERIDAALDEVFHE